MISRCGDDTFGLCYDESFVAVSVSGFRYEILFMLYSDDNDDNTGRQRQRNVYNTRLKSEYSVKWDWIKHILGF